MADLILHLKSVYWHDINIGDKNFEYRLYNEYWAKRLVDRKYENVIFCLGYPKKDDMTKRIVRKYDGYEIQNIKHPHFGKHEVKVFAIRTTGVTSTSRFLKNIKGIQPVDPELLKEFSKQMQEEVIPKIVKAVREREQAAEDSRREGRILY